MTGCEDDCGTLLKEERRRCRAGASASDVAGMALSPPQAARQNSLVLSHHQQILPLCYVQLRISYAFSACCSALQFSFAFLSGGGGCSIHYTWHKGGERLYHRFLYIPLPLLSTSPWKPSMDALVGDVTGDHLHLHLHSMPTAMRPLPHTLSSLHPTFPSTR